MREKVAARRGADVVQSGKWGAEGDAAGGMARRDGHLSGGRDYNRGQSAGARGGHCLRGAGDLRGLLSPNKAANHSPAQPPCSPAGRRFNYRDRRLRCPSSASGPSSRLFSHPQKQPAQTIRQYVDSSSLTRPTGACGAPRYQCCGLLWPQDA
ncbi:hypothetical protein E2C01_003486 [Portunus trituberculatus]|uniref:Uncharacterized protein n=1 Tax=Portunus trituberculatus TaxID=210409 RepID=A0A5B7CMB5_PORTR|nr:hypothetical protein [Portunus trituberculatus]